MGRNCFFSVFFGMKICEKCSEGIKGCRGLIHNVKYCKECRVLVTKEKNKSGKHKARRLCVVCKEPSFGRRHAGCEFKSLKSGRGSLSRLYHHRRHALKKRISIVNGLGVQLFINERKVIKG